MLPLLLKLLVYPVADLPEVTNYLTARMLPFFDLLSSMLTTRCHQVNESQGYGYAHHDQRDGKRYVMLEDAGDENSDRGC